MPVVRKLKYDIEGDGEITTISIMLHADGTFSANIPLHVKSTAMDCAYGHLTLAECLAQVNHLIEFYQKAKKTTERIILINFATSQAEFLNQGQSLHLNYLIADKVTFGKNVSYSLVKEDTNTTSPTPVYRNVGNMIPENFKQHYQHGCYVGHAIELPFEESTYRTLVALNDRLTELGDRLKHICGSKENILKLMESTIKLLQ